MAVRRKRVVRLMKAAGVAVLPLRRFVTTTDSDLDQPVAPNLLEQDFTATVPDQRWVNDITYIPTEEGWLFLAAIVDLYPRKMVGWDAIFEYIEVFYDRTRRQTSIGNVSSMDFELRRAQAA